MPPKRTFYRRVNKHMKTLHCECDKSYTRADHFERHKSTCGHTSEYVAASSPLPESSPDSRPFYCSCGAGFTAADAFLRHRNRMGHDGNWEQSRYQPRGYSAVPVTAEPQDDLVELTGDRSSDFDDSGLGSSIKGDGSDSPQGEDLVASPASDVTPDVEFSTQPEPSVNIIETSSETTDVTVVSEDLEVTSVEVTSLVETSQTLQVQQSEAADIEAVSLETEQTVQETQISVEITEDVSLETQPSTGQESEEQGTHINEDQENAVSIVVENDSTDKDDITIHQLLEETESLTSSKINRTDLPTEEDIEPTMVPDNVDRTDNNIDDHSSPDTAVPQQTQAPTTDSSTSPTQQTPKVQKSEPQSPKSGDPLRKSKKAGISKDRSPKHKVKRSKKKFLKKHCNALSSVIVGLLAAGYCVLSGRNMFTAATSSREWVVDSTALQHIAKDGNSFHNKGALYEECHWARRGWSCDWSGQVQLTFDNGKKLMLEDVSYQPRARSNVVSMKKLGTSGVSGYWNQNEIAVYNETSSEMVGKAVWGKSAYTLSGLVEKKTISTAPVIATPFSQSKTTSSSTISTSSKAVPTVTVNQSASLRKKSPTSAAVSPTRSSTTTTVPTPKSAKTVTDVTRKPLRAATSSLDITSLSATATESTHGPSPAITTGGKFAPYKMLKFLTETPSLPKLPTAQPAPSSSKKRSLEDATQSSSKKARTSSAVPSVAPQTAATPSSWSNWWPIAVPRVPWPTGVAPSANGTIPTLATPVPSASARVNAATATAKPSSTGDSSSSSGASWFRSFGSFGTKRVDPIQYTKKKLAEAKAETAQKNDDLKKRVGVEEKACPPCPPCLLSMPRINRGRTGIYI